MCRGCEGVCARMYVRVHVCERETAHERERARDKARQYMQ